MEKKLLILDLDETLIFATEARLDRAEDFCAEKYFVYERPGLRTFLEFVFHHFKVAVWTFSGPQYAAEVVRAIFTLPEELQFIWTRERCTCRLDPDSRSSYWIKDLKKAKKAGFPLESIVVIDDSPEKLSRNYGNHIGITPFHGSLDDCELQHLTLYLDWLKDVPDVRKVNKRNWRIMAETR